jgi:methylated-DNA-protein-cysteine methyltransferase related protein
MSSSEMVEHVMKLYRAIYAVVWRIPRGRVATYGQVAELAGIPGGARVAGAAMKTTKPGDQLPWQRVIGKAGRNRGRIAIHNPVGAAMQRVLLAKEGVMIGDTGLIALDRYGWLPADPSRPPGPFGNPSRQRKKPARRRQKPLAVATRGPSRRAAS